MDDKFWIKIDGKNQFPITVVPHMTPMSFHNFQLATLLVQVHLEAPAVAPTFLSLTVSALVGSTDTPLLATVVPETAFSVQMINIIRLFLLFQRPLPIIEQ